MPVPSRTEGLRWAVCLLLLLAASSATLAGEVRRHGANGNGGDCPEAALAEAAAIRPPDKRPPAATPGKARAPTTFRGSDDNDARTPRWHRFLPGMFR